MFRASTAQRVAAQRMPIRLKGRDSAKAHMISLCHTAGTIHESMTPLMDIWAALSKLLLDAVRCRNTTIDCLVTISMTSWTEG